MAASTSASLWRADSKVSALWLRKITRPSASVMSTAWGMASSACTRRRRRVLGPGPVARRPSRRARASSSRSSRRASRRWRWIDATPPPPRRRRASTPRRAVGAATAPITISPTLGRRDRRSPSVGLGPQLDAVGLDRQLVRGPLAPGDQAGRAAVLGQPAGHHVLDPGADVHGVVADALVVPADEGQLHGRLQVDHAAVVRLEDGLDVVLVQQVEAVVHVVEGGGQAGVALDVGVDARAGTGGVASSLMRSMRPRSRGSNCTP